MYKKQIIRINESQLNNLVTKIVNESINKILKEADRHREGYWKERWAKQKQEKQSEATTSSPKKKSSNNKKDRHRKGYYHDYNKAHPERLNRGFTKGYKNGNVSDGPDIGNDNKIFLDPDTYIIGYDEMGRPITNNPLSDLQMIFMDLDYFEDEIFMLESIADSEFGKTVPIYLYTRRKYFILQDTNCQTLQSFLEKVNRAKLNESNIIK